MLVVCALFAVAAAYYEYSGSDEKTVKLVQSLRKQLIENNYDYTSPGSEENVINMRARAVDDITTHTSTRNNNISTSKKYTEKLIFLKSQKVTTDKDIMFTTSKYTDIEVSKSDLLYYVDDRHFISKSGASTKKYKVLKLKKSRRSGTQRLIQEEGQDGISIVNLGGGPIPEFRLPRSRRQYMHHHGEVVVDEEPPKDTLVKNPYVVGA